MAISVDPKDPDEVLDYVVNWTARLAGDTITGSEFILASGDIVIDSDSFTTVSATVWVSGGTLNSTAEITNRVETAGGRTYDQTIKIKIKEK